MIYFNYGKNIVKILRMAEQMRHAWYSQKQMEAFKDIKKIKKQQDKLDKLDKQYCAFVYLNKDNEEVLCTSVTTEKKVHWDDAKYLGQVYKWVRSIEAP